MKKDIRERVNEFRQLGIKLAAELTGHYGCVDAMGILTAGLCSMITHQVVEHETPANVILPTAIDLIQKEVKFMIETKNSNPTIH